MSVFVSYAIVCVDEYRMICAPFSAACCSDTLQFNIDLEYLFAKILANNPSYAFVYIKVISQITFCICVILNVVFICFRSCSAQ